MTQRPLSPHLRIYHFGHTMTLSIVHRITGVSMAVGLCALVYWLMSAAEGELAYERATLLLSGWFFKVLLLGWLAAFCYHLVNGLRHLAWDAGLGLEKKQARVSAVLVLLVALVSFIILACLVCCPRGGTP